METPQRRLDVRQIVEDRLVADIAPVTDMFVWLDLATRLRQYFATVNRVVDAQERLVLRHRSRVNISHGMLQEGRHGQSRSPHHRDRGRSP
jgi:hypothetical protein